jgi:dTDP-4-dehydrorhamnose reductase
MKIAVTGTNGLLGQHLVQLLLSKDYQVVAISKGDDRTSYVSHPQYKYYSVDISEDFGLHDVLCMEEPDIFVHAAAITQVDECELNQDKCYEVNVQGTVRALVAAELYSKRFIYVSTDFVFDGEKGNYSENDETKPVSYYGETKLNAESLVTDCEIPWTIVRTCLVYGNALSGTRSNIISWVKQNLEQGKPIRVVSDQVRTPTYVEDLAIGILLIIEKNAEGIYHISGKDVLTPFEMAIRTAEYFGLDKQLIEKVDASVFSQPAKRPPKTGFDISKARKVLGYEPRGFDEGLRKMFENVSGES